MHIAKELVLEARQKLPKSITVSGVSVPLDTQGGFYIVDLFKEGEHVGLCLWSDKEQKFAIDFFPENDEKIPFENPVFCEPYYPTVEGVITVIVDRFQ